MAAEPALQLTGRDLTVPDVVAVARAGRAVTIADDARARMAVSRGGSEASGVSSTSGFHVSNGRPRRCSSSRRYRELDARTNEVFAKSVS